MKKRLDEAKATQGNVITHIGLLKRTDGKLFDPEATASIFEALYWFLCFMNGSRCTLTLWEGLRHLGCPLWQKWAVFSSTPVQSCNNWFEGIITNQCFEAADKFYASWTDAGKREWLPLAIGIYTASNHNTGGIELTLANSQIALEMLASIALLEENSLMSDKGFENLSAADKIRALLFWLGIDKSIPEKLTDLKSMPKEVLNTEDAPQAVVELRNKVTHLTRVHRGERAKIPNNAIFDAWQLNLWYIEVAILKLIGYSGAYNNRIQNPAGKLWDMLK